MTNDTTLENHISFEYTSFDRVVLRGYIQRLFVVSEFYFNGHNYLKKQFDLADKKYTMNDNSFSKLEDLEMLNNLVASFQPSIALGRISYWMDIFFKFNQGQKSSCSKLLKHNWFTYQTEISTNLIFKSAKFANAYFDSILSKHHTI